MPTSQIAINDSYPLGFHEAERYSFKSKKGLSHLVIDEISYHKNEPDWMRKFRHDALDIFYKKTLPAWGGDLSKINFDNIYYYIKPTEKKARSWKDLPIEIRRTYDRIGIPEAEKKYLGGVSAQYESEVVYKSIQKTLGKKGVVFLDMDSGLREYPDLVKEYFSTIIPPHDNKFAALNSATWSGGSFIYVPKGVNVELPLQAYFRINAANMGQFERTLIIADEGSFVHYVEGCTAPVYTTDSLHAAVVEIFVKKGARVRYTTIQNWSTNVYNLVTKRMRVEEEGIGEWIDGNLGCLTEDAKIIANDHVLSIKDIRPGDYLYSMTPEFTLTRAKLLAKVKNPPLPVFKITTEDFREVEATANHPFLVLKKKGKISYFNWMPLDKIKVGDLIAVSGKLPWVGKNYPIHFNPKRGKKEFFYPEISSEELLWLLGFYIGDGCMDKTRVYIAVPQSDKSFKKVIETINKLFGLKPEIKRNIVRYASTKFVDFLVKLGFKGKAQDKEVPEWIYTLPKSQITSFIEGYIDADGYRRDNHRNISITSVNKKLLQQVKDLSYITDKFSPRKISLWTRRERKPLGIEEKVYKHHFLYFGDDKKDSTIQFVRVNSIVPQGSKETFDIEVDKGNFIANGILVHNSKLTMKYPSVYLMGKGARGEVLSVAYAGPGQHQDAGGKAIHFAPYTSSKITSKSVSHGGGRTSYRGLLQVFQSAIGAKSKVVCDALLIDDESRSDTYPTMDIKHNDCRIEHEATVSKIGDDQLFYLMSRGINKPDAEAMVVNGFIEPIVKQLPLEYAVELNRLIQLEMEGSVG